MLEKKREFDFLQSLFRSIKRFEKEKKLFVLKKVKKYLHKQASTQNKYNVEKVANIRQTKNPIQPPPSLFLERSWKERYNKKK